MSLEVAEHLPESCAQAFVNSLTNLSKFVLFSAAIPGQQGRYHVNCQWPEYWAGFFRVRGYVPVDLIRPYIWMNENVEYWYRQNILFYIEQETLKQMPKLIQQLRDTARVLNMVHPACFIRYATPEKMSFIRTVGFLPKIAYYSALRSIKRIRSKN